MNNAKGQLANAQELLNALDSGKLNHSDAVDALTVIVTKIKLGETSWKELGTSYGACNGAVRLALIRDTRKIIDKLRKGLFGPEEAKEQARKILEKSMLSLDDIGTTREEIIQFLKPWI